MVEKSFADRQYRKAVSKAKRLAQESALRGKPREFFVVSDISYEQGDCWPYAVAGACHLDTFFAGCKIVFSTEE